MKFLFSCFLALAISPPCFAAVPNVKRQAVNVLRVASAVVDGETVTMGAVVYEVDTTVAAGITAGRIRLNLSGGSTAAAVGTLTLAGNAADTETVTVGGKAYTFQTTLTNVANNVKIGADASTSIDNLIVAINAGAGSGTLYAAATTANANVSAAAGAGDTMVVTARIPGAGGNSIASTETLATSGSQWGASTLASGVSPTAGEFTTAFTAAVNATNVLGFRVGATRVSANEVFLVNHTGGSASLAVTETLTGSNNAFAAATFYGGSNIQENSRGTLVMSRAANAVEAALQTMHFAAPFTPASMTVQVRSTAGVLKAFDGSIINTAGQVDVNGTGSTDIADTDIVTVTLSD